MTDPQLALWDERPTDEHGDYRHPDEHNPITDAGEQLAYYLGHILDGIAVHPNQIRAAIMDWDKATRQETP